MADANAPLIMGVDADETALATLKAAVERGGYRFLAARSGTEALELLARNSPRLIFTEIVLPKMNGFELALRLRTDFSRVPAPVIFVTARQGPEDVRGGLAAGGNDFLLKPIDPDKLINRIEVWLAKAHTIKLTV